MKPPEIEPVETVSPTAATTAIADRKPDRADPLDPPAIPHGEGSEDSVDRAAAGFEFGQLDTLVGTNAADASAGLEFGQLDTLTDMSVAADDGPPPMFGGAWAATPAADQEPQRDYMAASRQLLTARNIATACGILAFAEAAIIAGLLTRPAPTPPPPAPIPLTIDSPVAGDVVMVDGRQVGVTPFNLEVLGSMRSIRVHSIERLQAPPTSAGATASTTAAATGSARTPDALAAAGARQRRGGFRLSSPIELQVLEGERVLGSSADGPIVASAGTHQLDFINNALGFRQRQTVEIKTGEILGLTIRPPDGRISINALPWAQVWIDGKPVGETPLANLSVPLGEHEIIFRHPQLGEKREKTLVKADAAARLSVTMAR